MKTENTLQKGKIRVFNTSNPKPITALAVQVLGEENSKAIILDASTRINPYWIVRICKKHKVNKRDILQRMIVARGFTAYQLVDLIKKVEKLVKNEDVIFLGIIGLERQFLDDDLENEEGNFLRSNCIDKIKKIIRDNHIYCVIGVENTKILGKRNRGEFYGEECAHV